MGIEKVVAGELERLGLAASGRSAGRVGFEADKAGLAKALVGLRCADRVFLEAGRFRARDFDELYEGFKAIPWERWVGPQDRLVIEKARSIRSALSAQNAIQSVGQKAAYERLCGEYGVGRMPETAATVQTRVRIERDEATVELDLCGEALSRRGYRKRPTEAPLKESVAAAVHLLGADRIGHGVRAIEDPALLTILRDRQIPLEINPTSNICLHVYRRIAEHPLPHLDRMGLKLTINSDDPPLFNTTLCDEYRLLAGEFGYDRAGIARLARNAFEVNRAEPALKQRLLAEFDAWCLTDDLDLLVQTS
ncbi:MAG TPA: hypothetical protein PLW80_03200 [Spirochaetales bacterium]|nr:hypothetical protein [Spirochaetales bacterium]